MVATDAPSRSGGAVPEPTDLPERPHVRGDPGHDPADRPLERDGTSGRYHLVLLLILASVTAPFLAPVEGIGSVVTALLQAVTVLAALRVSGADEVTLRRTGTVLGVLLAVVALAAVGFVVTGVGTASLLDATRAIGLLLAGYVPVIIVRDLVRHPAISLQTVWAALCLYLLIGLAFAFAHLLVDRLAPGSYTRAMDDVTALYLSYVTLSTVGFGDVTPVSGPAQALAILQATLGQLYLVSIVAALVGNLGRVRRH
jgi:hypothetical protein